MSYHELPGGQEPGTKNLDVEILGKPWRVWFYSVRLFVDLSVVLIHLSCQIRFDIFGLSFQFPWRFNDGDGCHGCHWRLFNTHPVWCLQCPYPYRPFPSFHLPHPSIVLLFIVIWFCFSFHFFYSFNWSCFFFLLLCSFGFVLFMNDVYIYVLSWRFELKFMICVSVNEFMNFNKSNCFSTFPKPVGRYVQR